MSTFVAMATRDSFSTIIVASGTDTSILVDGLELGESVEDAARRKTLLDSQLSSYVMDVVDSEDVLSTVTALWSAMKSSNDGKRLLLYIAPG